MKNLDQCELGEVLILHFEYPNCTGSLLDFEQENYGCNALGRDEFRNLPYFAASCARVRPSQ